MTSSSSPTPWQIIRSMSDVFWNDCVSTTCTKPEKWSISQQKIKFWALWSPPRISHGQSKTSCHAWPTQLTSRQPRIPRLHQLLSPIHCGFSDIVIPPHSAPRKDTPSPGVPNSGPSNTPYHGTHLVHFNPKSAGSQSWFCSSRNHACAAVILVEQPHVFGPPMKGRLLHC